MDYITEEHLDAISACTGFAVPMLKRVIQGRDDTHRNDLYTRVHARMSAAYTIHQSRCIMQSQWIVGYGASANGLMYEEKVSGKGSTIKEATFNACLEAHRKNLENMVKWHQPVSVPC